MSKMCHDFVQYFFYTTAKLRFQVNSIDEVLLNNVRMTYLISRHWILLIVNFYLFNYSYFLTPWIIFFIFSAIFLFLFYVYFIHPLLIFSTFSLFQINYKKKVLFFQKEFLLSFFFYFFFFCRVTFKLFF